MEGHQAPIERLAGDAGGRESQGNGDDEPIGREGPQPATHPEISDRRQRRRDQHGARQYASDQESGENEEQIDPEGRRRRTKGPGSTRPMNRKPECAVGTSPIAAARSRSRPKSRARWRSGAASVAGRSRRRADRASIASLGSLKTCVPRQTPSGEAAACDDDDPPCFSSTAAHRGCRRRPRRLAPRRS